MLFADNETRSNLLNNEAVAKTVIELIREVPEHAVAIGIHGDWGGIKSSVLIEANISAGDKSSASDSTVGASRGSKTSARWG